MAQFGYTGYYGCPGLLDGLVEVTLEDRSITRFSGPLPPGPKDKGPQVLSDRIRASELRLIDGESNRIVSRVEAERLARERGLDLLVVSLDSSPPVVRLVDFGKFKFEAEKKAREAKKKQHVVEIKELKMGIRIDDHDYGVKLNHGKKFLSEGNKVKLTIRLKGREVQHSNLAYELAHRFVQDLKSHGTLEGSLRMEGRTLIVNLQPVKQPTAKPASAASSEDEDALNSSPTPAAS